ncbi:short chain dehydrogenase reductase [Aspergillus sp. HF37]|nr:short chain dehydrogenase reductase [Aspergillus sp. HF37]
MSKRSIIVTGGASGIGQALTTHFASTTNTHITLLDINPTTTQSTLAALRAQFPSASISQEPCDVSSWDSQAAAFERVFNAHGRIDYVCANAGITEKGSLMPAPGEDVPSKPDLRTVEVNFLGVLYNSEGVKLAIFYILKNDLNADSSRGGIICTASSGGLYGFHVAPVYSATKHAVVGLVRSMQRYLGQEGIRINAIAPAVIETNIAPDKALFRSMTTTPVDTAVRAVSRFVEDPSLNGKVAELHGEDITFAEQKEYADESTRENIEMFWKLGYA